MLDEKVSTCCLPIIQGVSSYSTINGGSAFLLCYYNIDFIVTAYHCLFDKDSGKPLNTNFGFQGRIKADERFLLPRTIIDKKFDILVNTEYDVAIIPLKISQEVKGAIIHESITYDDTFIGVLKPNISEGLSFGFRLSKSAITKKVDPKEAEKLGLSKEVIKWYENKEYPVWLPYLSKTTYLGYSQDKMRLLLNTEAISGFSGGPVFINNHGKFQLVGITTDSYHPHPKFFEEFEGMQMVASGAGIATYINIIYEIINDENNFEALKNRNELLIEDLLQLKAHYIADDEFVLHNDLEILQDYATKHGLDKNLPVREKS